MCRYVHGNTYNCAEADMVVVMRSSQWRRMGRLAVMGTQGESEVFAWLSRVYSTGSMAYLSMNVGTRMKSHELPTRDEIWLLQRYIEAVMASMPYHTWPSGDIRLCQPTGHAGGSTWSSK